jgi:monovalent cation:H+ antiporter, CPA1 family
MSIFDILGGLVVIVAIFAYLNHKFLHLPSTIGVMLISLAMSIVLILFEDIGVPIHSEIQKLLGTLDFKVTLLRGMLSFLLFAGAIQLNLSEMLKVKATVAVLAIITTLVSAFLVGTVMYYLLILLGLPIDYIFCLLFGSIISPTDPVAVLAMLQESKDAPASLKMEIAGESLFNDGVGIVLFITISKLLSTGNATIEILPAVLFFFQEVLGGIIFGFALGHLIRWLFSTFYDFLVEVMLTIALVMGGYSLALYLGISGPIAMVVAGLVIGLRQQNVIYTHLEKFWTLVEELLNLSLFVLIGLEILMFSIDFRYLIIGIVSIPIVLLIRFISVWLPNRTLNIWEKLSNRTVRILTWGGLKGGLAIAMALAIPTTVSPEIRQLIISITYVVVIFSIIVQGLTFRKIKFKKNKS